MAIDTFYQSRLGKQDKGLSFQFFREVNDGERYNFSGDTTMVR